MRQKAVDRIKTEVDQAFAMVVPHEPRDRLHRNIAEAKRINEGKGRRNGDVLHLERIEHPVQVRRKLAFDDFVQDPGWQGAFRFQRCNFLPQGGGASLVVFDEEEDDFRSSLSSNEMRVIQEGPKGDQGCSLLTSAVPSWPGKAVDEENPTVVSGHDG